MKYLKALLFSCFVLLISITIFKFVSFKTHATETAGSIDTTFSNFTTTTDYDVTAIASLSNGQFIIGGYFDSYNGENAHAIARINGDGSLDSSFSGNLPVNFYVDNIVIQNDGKILVDGRVGYINPPRAIYRLNSDGTLDTSFNAPSFDRANSGALDLGLQSDGKIIVSHNTEVTRLNVDGSLDTTFNAIDKGIYVYRVVILSDDSIIVAGNPNSQNCEYKDGLIKTDKDGNLDGTFLNGNVGLGGIFNSIKDVQISSDGSIWIGGNFTQYHGTQTQGIAKLHSNGTLDASFTSFLISGSYDEIDRIILQPDGRIVGTGLIYGNIDGNADENYRTMVRFNADGSKDTSFDSGYGGSDYDYVCAMLLLDNNKLLVGGYFSNYNGTGAANLVKINLGEYLDIVAPTGSVNINSGALSTTAPEVTLNLSATDNKSEVSNMMICSNNSFTGCDWESYSTAKSFTLPSDNGVKTVYVKYRDSSGNVSDIYNDTIVLLSSSITTPTGNHSVTKTSTTVTTSGNTNTETETPKTFAIKVLDQFGKPIVGAVVTLESGVTGYTDNQGVITFEDVTTGNQKVTVSYQNHQMESVAEVLGTETSEEPKVLTLNLESQNTQTQTDDENTAIEKTDSDSNTLQIVLGILGVAALVVIITVVLKKKTK